MHPGRMNLIYADVIQNEMMNIFSSHQGRAPPCAIMLPHSTTGSKIEKVILSATAAVQRGTS